MDNFVNPESTYRALKSTAQERVEKVKDKIKNLPKGTVISYEPPAIDHGVAIQLDAMLAAQAFELTCINGYSATSPRTFTPYWNLPNPENRKFWLSSQGLEPDLPVVIE